MKIDKALQRKLFMIFVGVSAINLISFTKDFIAKFLDYSFGPLTVGTLIGLVLLYSLKKYYDRDL